MGKFNNTGLAMSRIARKGPALLMPSQRAKSWRLQTKAKPYYPLNMISTKGDRLTIAIPHDAPKELKAGIQKALIYAVNSMAYRWNDEDFDREAWEALHHINMILEATLDRRKLAG